MISVYTALRHLIARLSAETIILVIWSVALLWTCDLNGQELESSRIRLYPEETKDLMRLLYQHVEIKVFKQTTDLKSVLNVLGNELQARAVRSVIVVDTRAFGGDNTYTRPIAVPSASEKMQVRALLGVILKQLPMDAMLLSRPWALVITTAKKVGNECDLLDHGEWDNSDCTSRTSAAATATAQERKTAEHAIAETAVLLESFIQTNEFQEPMPFAKYLAMLEARLPPDKKRTIRLDEPGLGKEYAAIAAAPVQLPSVPKQMSIGTAMRLGIGQVLTKVELDYDVRPTGIVITRRQFTVREVVYDIRDVVAQLPSLVPELKRQHADTLLQIKQMPHLAPWLRGSLADLDNVDAGDGAAVLLRLFTMQVECQPGDTVQLQNNARLKVLAQRRTHAETCDLLAALRRFADRAVVMNARLYEVDRAFFANHVARLFPRDPETNERPAVVPIDGALIKKIAKQKLLLEGGDAKLRPHQLATFLAMQNVIRYAAEPGAEPNAARFASVLDGVSFAVRPLLSPDLRYLRLQITQDATELVRIDKTRKRNASAGNEKEIELPILLKSSRSGTVQVSDRDPFLMPVGYRPPGKGKEDRIWLLVARPQIWIQEEQDEIKAGNIEGNKFNWAGPTSKDEEPPPAPALPLDDDIKEILQAVVTDVLTSKQLKDDREFWGQHLAKRKDKVLNLLDGEKVAWPKNFAPESYGYRLIQGDPDPFAGERSLLAIRLEKFDLKQKNVTDFDAPIVLRMFNTGAFGGCSLYYLPKRDGKRWTVELQGVVAP